MNASSASPPPDPSLRSPDESALSPHSEAPSPVFEAVRSEVAVADAEANGGVVQVVARPSTTWRSLRLRRADPTPGPVGARAGDATATEAETETEAAGDSFWQRGWDRAQLGGRLRWPSSRWPLIGAGVAVGLALLIFLIVQGYAQARGWLSRQPQFIAKPEEIELNPPPPQWLAAGQAGVVRRVKDAAHWPETWSTLALDLEKIAEDFRFHCAWAEKVVQVERAHPNRIRVTLRYREPVARFLDPRANPRFASVSKTPQSDVILDRHGVILPAADLDPKFRQSLIRFDAMNDNNVKLDILPPRNPQPGTVWGRRDSDKPLTVEEKRIVDAAALAWYLREFPGADSQEWLSDVVINPTCPDGIFLWVQPRTWAFWGEAIGQEAPTALSSERKRTEFFRWARERVAQGPPPKLMIYYLPDLRYSDNPAKEPNP